MAYDWLPIGGVTETPCVVQSVGNLALTGLPMVDGVDLQPGDRVLARGQTISTDNGIYIAATGAWERSDDFIPRLGARIYVTEGYFPGEFVVADSATLRIIGVEETIFNHLLPELVDVPAGASLLATEGDAPEWRILTKADLGLALVDNTSDLGKPISTATQAALDGIDYSVDSLDGSITSINQSLASINIGLGLKLDAASYTAADVLTKLLTVDGASSGIDAPLFAGRPDGSYTRGGFAVCAPNGAGWITFPANTHYGAGSIFANHDGIVFQGGAVNHGSFFAVHVTKTGWYDITLRLYANASAQARMHVAKNGNALTGLWIQLAPHGADYTVEANRLVQLNANDWIGYFCDSANASFYWNPEHSGLSIRLMKEG